MNFRFAFLLISLMSLLPTLGFGTQTDSASVTASHFSEPQEYLLGPGDLVRISVYGNPDMLTDTRISAQNTITFPLLGEVKLGGQSTKSAESMLASMLEKNGYLKYPQVNVVVTQYQSYGVSVLGDVYKPGKYSLDRPSRLSEVVALAGGVTPNGSDIVTLTRVEGGKTVKQDYDMREVISDITKNPQILAGDTLFINAREVSVLGHVNRPGKYSVTNGVRTVLDFLSQAGGPSINGADKIIVISKNNGSIQKYELDIDELYRNGDTSANFELGNGDSIYVPKAPIFYIYGEVQRPGSFRLERNMSVAQALSAGGGLSPRGTERGMEIKRYVDGKLKTIDAVAGDILQPDDIVYVSESLF